MKFSALFWPVELKGKTIYILDETLLPDKVEYIKARNYKEAVKAIRQMKTRAVGQVLLVMYTLLLEYNNNKTNKDLNSILAKAASAINNSRPTLSFRMLTQMVLEWQEKGMPLEKTIPQFLEGLKHKRIRQAEECCQLLEDKDVILSHCNISGLLPLIGSMCKCSGKTIKFVVTETRPYLQGSRLTAWELKNAGFDVTVIADNMVAQVMLEKRVQKVVVGADHLAQNGDIANKIGTFQIALLAQRFSIPFYVICPPASGTKSGRDINIEIRPENELLQFGGKRIAPKGVRGYYPAFDVTPADLITKHIYLK